MFGIQPSKVRTGYAKFEGQGALSHLGIQVETTDDVTAMKNRWQESGLVPRDELQTTCCYALQDKAWVNDPDGNEWEVFTVIEDNLRETDSKVGGDAKRRLLLKEKVHAAKRRPKNLELKLRPEARRPPAAKPISRDLVS